MNTTSALPSPRRLAVVVLAVALGATACSRSGSDENAFQWVSELPAGTTIHLLNGAGEVEVKRADGQTANIVGSRHWRRGRARDVNFVVTRRNGDYYICAMWRNSGRCGEDGYRGRNTGGFLAMFSLFNRHSDVKADFVAELPANVAVDVRNSNGEVTIEGLTAGVRARTVNGDVKAMNVGGKISLSTVNGSLELETAPNATIDAISLNTTNGQIRAELPANAEGAFDISTVNGDVSSEFALGATSKSSMRRHLRGQIGSAERAIKMRSVNGSVTITRAGTTVRHY